MNGSIATSPHNVFASSKKHGRSFAGFTFTAGGGHLLWNLGQGRSITHFLKFSYLHVFAVFTIEPKDAFKRFDENQLDRLAKVSKLITSPLFCTRFSLLIMDNGGARSSDDVLMTRTISNR
jgi:hypothetical protein